MHGMCQCVSLADAADREGLSKWAIFHALNHKRNSEIPPFPRREGACVCVAAC